VKRANALALVLLLGLSGCTQWYYDLGSALPEGYEQSAEGDSLAEVLATLGPPMRFAANEGGMMMAWEAWRIREDAIGVSLGWVGADFLTVDWGSAHIRGDYFLLSFDDEHRVNAAARVRRDDDIGSGAAIQPFFGFVSVVSVDDLLLPLPQHAWGAAQLFPLPGVLNNPERPGMGDTGIEQRGTPLGAGARTLEWLD